MNFLNLLLPLLLFFVSIVRSWDFFVGLLENFRVDRPVDFQRAIDRQVILWRRPHLVVVAEIKIRPLLQLPVVKIDERRAYVVFFLEGVNWRILVGPDHLELASELVHVFLVNELDEGRVLHDFNLVGNRQVNVRIYTQRVVVAVERHAALGVVIEGLKVGPWLDLLALQQLLTDCGLAFFGGD